MEKFQPKMSPMDDEPITGISGQSKDKIEPGVFEYFKNLKPEDFKLKEKLVALSELVPGINEEGMVSLDRFSPNAGEHYEDRVLKGLDLTHQFSAEILVGLTSLEVNEPEMFKKFQEKFSEVTIVDLGAGGGNYDNSSTGYFIASMLKAKGYVGVEPFNWRDIFKSFLTSDDIMYADVGGIDEKWVNNVEPIPFNIVVDDAVSFLKRLPDESVFLLSAGLRDVVSDISYGNELSQEMLRVLKKHGICLANNSWLPEGFTENNLTEESKEVKKIRGNTGFYLEKK